MCNFDSAYQIYTFQQEKPCDTSKVLVESIPSDRKNYVTFRYCLSNLYRSTGITMWHFDSACQIYTILKLDILDKVPFYPRMRLFFLWLKLKTSVSWKPDLSIMLTLESFASGIIVLCNVLILIAVILETVNVILF